jgi:hypothetical protein
VGPMNPCDTTSSSLDQNAPSSTIRIDEFCASLHVSKVEVVELPRMIGQPCLGLADCP